ncbi:MAG: STAS domain-containing protein [Actinomycetota bacterium]|nr:STAS domain-containing protein [Actinomycetota bacterium]
MTAAAPDPPGRIWTVHEHGGAVLHLSGEIDAATVASYEAGSPGRRMDGTAPAMVMALDTAAVTFMSAAGISLLLRETAPLRAAGRRPVLRRPSRSVRRILDLTGVGAFFDWR